MDIHQRSLSPLKSPMLQHHLSDNFDISCPWKTNAKSFKKLLIGKDGVFRASVDCHDFTASEVQVTTAGHTIKISASHDEKEDEFSTIQRKFSKKFILPMDLDMLKITSWFSNGVLYLKVPPVEKQSIERIVSIKLEEDKGK